MSKRLVVRLTNHPIVDGAKSKDGECPQGQSLEKHLGGEVAGHSVESIRRLVSETHHRQ